MKYDLNYIEKIAKIINENNLSEISLEDGEEAITIRKDIYEAEIKPKKQEEVTDKSNEETTVSKATIQNKKEPIAITSPMVGAFYTAPTPGAKPYVKVGDTVGVGQVVCIIEAMKLMNEIESEVSGKITQICVEDGQSVEYGQILMYVE